MMKKGSDLARWYLIVMSILIVLSTSAYATNHWNEPEVHEPATVHLGASLFGDPEIEKLDANTLVAIYTEEDRNKKKNIYFARSTDAGATWTKQKVVREAVSARLHAPAPNLIYIAVLDAQGDLKLLKSTDRGLVFEYVSDIAHFSTQVNALSRLEQVAAAAGVSLFTRQKSEFVDEFDVIASLGITGFRDNVRHTVFSPEIKPTFYDTGLINGDFLDTSNPFFWAPATDFGVYALNDGTVFFTYIEESTLKLIVSQDGGRTWGVARTVDTNVEPILAANRRVNIFASDEDTLYISYVRDTKIPMLAYSSDGGVTWLKRSPEEGKSYQWIQGPDIIVFNKARVYLTYTVYEGSRDQVQSSKPRVAITTTNGRYWRVANVDTAVTTFMPQDAAIHILDERNMLATFVIKSGPEASDPYKMYMTFSNDDGITWTPPKEITEIQPYSSTAKVPYLIIQSYQYLPFGVQSLTLIDSSTAGIAYIKNQPPSVNYVTVGNIFKSLCIGAVAEAQEGDAWQGTILTGANPCCGDQEEKDLGFIGAGADGINKFLCTQDAGSWKWLEADRQNQHWQVRATGKTSAVSNSQEWFRCEESTQGKAITPSDPAYTYKAHIAKFYCENRGGKYRFAECCTGSSSEGAAGNTALDERVCEGGTSDAFTVAPGEASTLLLHTNGKTFTQSDFLVFTAGNDFDVTDWSDYSQLDVIFKISGQPSVSVEIVDSSDQVDLSAQLTDYVVNTPLLGSWAHAQIPLRGIEDVGKVRFRYTSSAVPGFAESTEFAIAQAYLVPTANVVAFCSESKYLDRSVESPWLIDMDKNNLDGSIPPEPAGKSACNAIPGFNWTGTRCCGDDNIPGFTEYFNDTMGSCWNGNPLFINESVMDVVLITSKNGVQKNFTYYCSRANCTYPTPPGFPYTLAKSSAHTYDLYFVPQSTQVPILASNGLTITEPGLIEARQVAQQVITQNGTLYSCNPSPHIQARSIPFQCALKQACDTEETELFGLSAASNAHLELLGIQNYSLRLCCGGIPGVGNQCSGNYEELLKLSDATNAHAGKPGQSSYTDSVCLSVPQSTPLDCQFSQTSPGNGYTCLFSISGDTNAHIGRCGTYAENMYCRAENTIPLTYSRSSCTVLGNSFCSPELGWSNASSTYPPLTIEARNRTVLKSAGSIGIQSSSCCSAATCWNGEFCAVDQSAVPDPNNAEIYSDARCIAGAWTSTPLVFTWDKRNFGYCPTSSQCLVDLDGDGAFNNNPSAFFEGNKPLCINDSQFIMDNYCAASNWTTRTRLIALELLNLVDQTGNPSNYTLFCDDYSKALVDTQYGTVLESILGPSFSQFGTRNCFTETQEAVPCVNNFCVLDYSTPSGTKKVLGVSLNKAVHDPRSGFLAGLGLQSGYCTNAQGTGLFRKCSSDNKVWYSPEINATIYSKEGVELYQQTTGIVSWFSNLFNGIISWFMGSQPSTGPDYAFVTNSSGFGKLYLAPRPLDLSTQSTRAVQGFQESIGDNQFLLVKYTNFPANLCTYVQNKAQVSSFGSSLQLSNLVCINQGNETIVFTHDPVAMGLWQDLTSKLRIS